MCQAGGHWIVELETNLREVLSFTITKKTTRDLSWLKTGVTYGYAMLMPI